MNMTPSDSESLVIEILKKLEKRPAKNVEAIVAPPFTSLDCVWSLVKGTGKVQLAGQNCHQELISMC